ncbi:MAG: hypothetical protein Q8T09_19485 [Candidatus Melainabacteria bacterium]|nr:hypothetical protein [Candidatus Melainabacteria bacterium]
MISQSKSNRYPENLNLTTSPRRLRVVPRALSLLLSVELVCSTFAFSALAGWQPVRAAEAEVTEKSGQSESVSPSWNDSKSDSMFIIESDAVKKVQPQVEPKAEVKVDEKAQSAPELKPELKPEVKVEAQPEAKSELKSEVKAEDKAEDKAEASKPDANGKAIAEVAPLAPAAAVTPGSAVITTAPKDSAATATTSTTTSSSSSSSTVPASSEEVIVVDSDGAPEGTGVSAVSTPTSSAAVISSPGLQAISGGESAHGLEAGSVLSPNGKNLLGDTGAETPKVGGGSGALSTVDSLSADMLVELGASVVETGVNAPEQIIANGDGPIVIDSDEVSETEETIQYENLPTDEGKTRIKTGAKFPVVVTSQISSKNAHKGDGLEARLKFDLKIGDRLIAKKGSAVQGHINYALPARSVMHSLVSANRWYRNSGCLGVEFDEIVTEKGEHLPLVATPAKAALFIKNKAEGRVLGVNHLGQVAGPWEQQLKYKAVRIGLNAAMAPVGVFSFGAMPVALGLMGAANPSFAFMKPVGTNVRHRRIKGFAWGFLSGVPGSWLIEDTVVKGNEAIIKPGDEFLVEFKQEFTGEPASEAQMLPNANAKVHGDVRTSKKKTKQADSK